MAAPQPRRGSPCSRPALARDDLAAAGTAPAPFTRAGMRRGVVAVQPLAFGVFVYGVTFGLLAAGAGHGVVRALLMSAGIYSGTAQIVAIGTLATGTGLFATVGAVALLNARYVLYGAALNPWLRGVGRGRVAASLFLLGDGNWVVAMRARTEGERDAGFILGSGLAMYVAWLAGTLVGGTLGDLVPDPRTLGLDFLLVGFCAAMGIGIARLRGLRASAGTIVAALAAAVAADRYAGPGWPVLAAGVAGMAAAWLAQRLQKAVA